MASSIEATRVTADAASSSASRGSRFRASESTTSRSGIGSSPTARSRSSRPRPVSIASGMPPTKPLIVVSWVLKSPCASSQSSSGRIAGAREAGHHGDRLAAVAAERDRPLAGAGGAFDQIGERGEDHAGARHLVAVGQRGSVQRPAAALGDAIQAGHRSIEQRRCQDSACPHGRQHHVVSRPGRRRQTRPSRTGAGTRVTPAGGRPPGAGPALSRHRDAARGGRPASAPWCWPSPPSTD